MMEREFIKGIGVTTFTIEEILGRVYRYMERGEKGRVIACANPHSIVLALHDEELSHTLTNADICLPDGTGVVIASRILGGMIKKRIAGPDFFEKFTDYSNRNGKNIRYFFLGSTSETLGKIKRNIERTYQNIEVCGIYSPPFPDWSEEENEKIIESINQSNVHALWVGLGAPKQEKWIEKNRDRLDVNIIGAIGAAFDFFAGTKRRSPELFRNAGLEWLPRFLMEPRRLWKRNLLSTPKFLLLIAKEKMRRG